MSIDSLAAVNAPACAADEGSWCAWIWHQTGLGWLAQNAPVVGGVLLRILLIVLLALIIRRLAHKGIDKLTSATADGQVPALLRPLRDRADAFLSGSVAVARREQRAKSIGSLLKSIVSTVVMVTTIIVVLAELGINVTPLLASAGIAGIALGFGAQNLVKDFLSGIFMLLEDQYGVGDTVDLGSATGTVTAVGLRTTTLRGPDGTVWYVRNGEVLRVGNSSQGESVVTIDLPLSYRSDSAKAGDLALAAAAEVAGSDEFTDVVVSAPELQGIVSMTSEGVTIRLVATVKAGKQWAFGRAVRDSIKAVYDREGIEAPAADLRRFGGTGPGSGPNPRVDDAT